ncbi:tyrosine-protein phosphatase [Maritalea mobilis]|uniref:phosphatase domain-containing protein n=1 Tax=Maritalea mobilis TaxID=483324 RepID=UPI001C97E45F|nr:tyrosine-protein phosphatase [Maritalea mobilis]MBY6200691.1 tyrosine-protein phosphatase [Maritalea mobilis]
MTEDQHQPSVADAKERAARRARKAAKKHSVNKSMNRWLRDAFSHRIDRPWDRFMSGVYTHLFDHAALRAGWHNFKQVAPKLYRSNHPSPRRLRRYAGMGITHVLTLRGGQHVAPYRFEAEACEKHGMTLLQIPLSAQRAPKRARLLSLLDLFEDLDAPMLVHCKSGADRTGLAAAMYLIAKHDVPAAEAKRELSLARLHAKWSKAGVLDLFLADAAEAEARGVPLRQWIETEYDQEETNRRFRAMSRAERLRL